MLIRLVKMGQTHSLIRKCFKDFDECPQYREHFTKIYRNASCLANTYSRSFYLHIRQVYCFMKYILEKVLRLLIMFSVDEHFGMLKENLSLLQVVNSFTFDKYALS